MPAGLQQLYIRALFKTPEEMVQLLLNVRPGSSLFKVTVVYLGSEPFSNSAIATLSSAMTSENFRSVKTLALTIGREHLKHTLERKLRETQLK